MAKYKHLHNDFFTWMDGIYEISHLEKSAGTREFAWYDVYWADDPQNFYGFSAWVFWKTADGKYGYDNIYHYAYDDTTLRYTSGPFTTFEELRFDYECEGGHTMPFPEQDLMKN